MVAAGLCAGLAALVLVGLGRDLAAGGNPWKQGDWLISLAAGPLRRGALGSAILWLSDASGIGPAATVAAIQAALVVTLFALTLRAAWRHLGHPAMALILLSPGVFPLFWAGDPQGAGRKELIAFTAMALVAAGQVAARPRLPVLALAAAVFLTAVLGHEGNALLAPAFALQLWLALRQAPAPMALSLGLPAAVLAGSAALMALALAHPSVADASALCAPLLQRGLPEWFCHYGAIGWMDKDAGFALAEVQKQASLPVLAGFATCYLLAALPVLVALGWFDHRRLLLALFALTGLACAPLFAVGADWGRWLDWHLTSFAFLAMSLLLAGRVALRPVARCGPALALLALGLIWSPAHMVGTAGLVSLTPVGAWLGAAPR